MLATVTLAEQSQAQGVVLLVASVLVLVNLVASSIWFIVMVAMLSRIKSMIRCLERSVAAFAANEHLVSNDRRDR